MSLPKTFDLKAANGKTIQIPSVGFGTWASGSTDWAKESIITALKAGYRHLDCAWMYGVDQAVGDAIRESGIPREEIFVTTKFWPHFARPDGVELCMDKCLQNMGLDYVDLWLAHWPLSFKFTSREALENAHTGPDATSKEQGIAEDEKKKPVVDWEYCTASIAQQAGKEGSFVPVFKAMQECVRKGKAKTIGVSNFTATEIEELLPHEDGIPVSCNQVEIHPWLPQAELVAFGQKHGIVITCYSPFAGQKEDGATLLKDEKIKGLAEKNGMDVGQLLQSWAVQRGTVPLGKSATPDRIKSNLAIKKLSDEDMRAIGDMALPGHEGRTVDPRKGWGVGLYK